MNLSPINPLLYVCIVVCTQCTSSKVSRSTENISDRQYWQDDAANLQEQLDTGRIPGQYRLLRMDIDKLKASLQDPADPVIVLPGMEEGFFAVRVENSSVMSPALAAKYPGIGSFRGVELPDDLLEVRVDVNSSGFFAMVTTLETSYFIHPVSRGSDHYFCYDKKFAKRDMENPFYDTIKKHN